MLFLCDCVVESPAGIEANPNPANPNPGFDPSFDHLACLATLKSCDTTKQSVCGWYIYDDKNVWME